MSRRVFNLRKVLNAWGLYLHVPVPGEIYKITDAEDFEEDFKSLDEVEAWMDGRTWTVTAINRHSGHRSRVKPFRSAHHAAYFVKKHRPEKDWKDVRMTSQSRK